MEKLHTIRYLWEFRNSYQGESYTRAYVWAENEVEAKKRAEKVFKASAKCGQYPDDYWKDIQGRWLFSSERESFATVVSSAGFVAV